MKIALSNIVNSPFRNFSINPIREEKIESLCESINTTGFWKNIVVRENGHAGKFEIVVGHHRVQTLRRMNSASTEFDFNVIKATDAEVLQRMSRDHDDRYNHDLTDTVELVRATVKALSDGKIGPMEIPRDTNDEHIRFAPSFVPGRSGKSTEGRYTVLSIASFLGLTDKKGTTPLDKIRAAFKMLELMERNIWTEKVINTFRRPEDGAIPVDRVLKVAREQETQEATRQQDRAHEAARVEAKNQARLKVLIEKRKREQEAATKLRERGEALRKEREKHELTEKQQYERKQADRELNRLKKELETIDARIKYKKEQAAREKQQTAERAAKKADEEARRWVNRVLDSVDKTYDRHSIVRHNVLDFTGKDAPINSGELKQLIATLNKVAERMREDAAKLEDTLKVKQRKEKK